MKKIYYSLIILLLFLVSCNYYLDYMPDMWNFDVPNVEMKNTNDIGVWISKNIIYKNDTAPNWQTPKETLHRGKGDCEDKAILMMGLIYKKFGKKSNLLLVSTKHNCETDHAIVSYRNRQIDNNGEFVNYQVIQTISFDNLPYWMRRAK